MGSKKRGNLASISEAIAKFLQYKGMVQWLGIKPWEIHYYVGAQ